MKKIIFILLFGLISTPLLHSQILISLLLGDKLNSENLQFGIEGGLNWSNISGFKSKAYAQSFNMGFYFDFKFKKRWGLNTGLLVKSQLGTKNLSQADIEKFSSVYYGSDGSYNQVIDYFIVPVLAKYRFTKSIYVEAGPQGGLMYNAWVEYNLKSDQSDNRIRNYNEDQINRIDAGFTIGTGYVLLGGKGFTLGVKYYQGLVNTYKGNSSTQNRSFFVKMNIPIGVGDKKENTNTQNK